MGGSSEAKSSKSKQNTKTNSTTTQKSTTNYTGQSDTQVTAPDWVTQAWKNSQGDYGDIVDQFNETPWQTLASQGFAEDVAYGNDPFSAVNTSLKTLSDTARGDYLYGGEAFNAAVDAAFRAGMPQVLSAFGAGGRSDGGLAKVALAQAYADPFAAQFGQERGRQLQAAQLLPGQALLPSSILEAIGGNIDARTLQQAQLEQNSLNYLLPWLGSSTATSGSSTTKGTSKTKGKNAVAGVVMPGGYGGNSIMQGAGGALSGAATGASLGSVVPGIGTGVGALAGGLLGGIGAIA